MVFIVFWTLGLALVGAGVLRYRVCPDTIAGVLAFIIGVIITVVTVALYGSVTLDRSQCRAIAEHTGHQTKYPDITTGCLVYIDGQWFPIDTGRFEQ